MAHQAVAIFNDLVKQKFVEVNDAFPSIYTKDDVIAFLKGLAYDFEQECEHNLTEVQQEQKNPAVILENFIVKLRREFLDAIECEDFSDCVDNDTAEFELNGNEISLSCVQMNNDVDQRVNDIFNSAVDEVFQATKFN